MRLGVSANRRNSVVIAFLAGAAAYGAEEPPGLRERFLNLVKAEMARVPDFVCTQNVERFSRTSPDQAWQKVDTVRFEVALVGDHELYSLPGARGFHARTPAGLIGRGTISTGQFALLAKHVFLTSTAQFTYKGETEQNGRSAYEYTYDVPAKQSSYHLRSQAAEAVVAFQGSFWMDRDSLDLIRLEVQPYDIPEPLHLTETETVLDYSRVMIDGTGVLLPVAASLSVVTAEGESTLNRTRLGGCRHYRSESTIQFATEAAQATNERDRRIPPSIALPAGALLELTLDSSLDPATSRIGDTVHAILARPVKQGETVIVPPGVPVTGRLVRMEKTTMPFPIYRVGLQLEELNVEGGSVPLTATMIEAGPAAGLLRQSKELSPVFSKKRDSRIDILVREVQRGQGVLDWDARRAPIPRGLHMKWRVMGEALTTAEDPKPPRIERQDR